MSNWPFRFLHAADFHLETPPFGLEEVPDHLSEILLDAAYVAAERVFDTAVAEDVDFLVLSGDILHSQHTGPRGPIFLVAQFERLAERNIAVYWSGGRVDPPEAWPASIALPDNVHVFPRGRPGSRVHRRGDTPLARLIGAARTPHARVQPEQFDPKEAGLFSIAVSHGRAPLDALRASRVDYWALGGRHSRSTPCEAMPVVHAPGSPQGRHPDETGTHGCTLVEVDIERNARLTFVETDAVRWEEQPITLDAQSDRESLHREMDQRIETLRAGAPKANLLLNWHVSGEGDLLAEMRHGTLVSELIARLQKQFGAASPVAWTVGLSVDPPARYAKSWYEEDSIRGEFLRHLRRREKDADEPLELEACLAGSGADDPAGKLVLDVPEASREALLREAAMLGVDLLAPQEYES